MSKKVVNREEELKTRFNKAINNIVSPSVNDKDYYNTLSAEQFINLKKALSNINNIITFKTTLAFVDQLASSGLIEESAVEDIKEKINSQSANANGFDILWDTGDFRFIAEVKCNIPVGKNTFGSAQLEGIYRDIISLRQGKGNVDVQQFNKFMVFLDCGKIEAAIENLINSQPAKCYIEDLKIDPAILNELWVEKKIKIIKWNKLPTKLEPTNVYICVVPVDANSL